MGKVTRRQPKKGETVFGARGVLMPFASKGGESSAYYRPTEDGEENPGLVTKESAQAIAQLLKKPVQNES